MFVEDTFVTCAQGHRHWGLHGAAGLLLTDPERGVLLQRRAWWTHHGRTWALPGGAKRPGETAAEAATREADEEAAVPPEVVRPLASSTVDHGGWDYTTVLAVARDRVSERVRNKESTELRWVPVDEVAEYRLHRDFALAWPDLRTQVGRELVLVVDAANVMGSRPDGWWRDRAGAAARLRDQLAPLALTGMAPPLPGEWYWWPRVVLVVEGQARGVTSIPGVEVVPATRDGDSEIVSVVGSARAEDHVLVATADRELRSRVEAAGATVMGPRPLLNLLS
ncbi:NUDIX domain-containing protein [Amycolatopsis sp. 195334CR]|uniref:NUDIX domain-containing protein n=1 Tax=Amycolatopsis sp. 195334CR TaxID=2814588 RepID=UPI001A8C93E9|nr:NUDIX domain-containing protein [Amycolatopsis sp. 195334CR]MBN6041513.1 NUDIX domain-containing protein [Amycolatopsis sp. 195334CR]